MKKLSIIVVVFAFCLVFCLYADTLFSKINNVNNISDNYDSLNLIIDAGHGGRDNGTSAKDGTAEKGINLSIAVKLNDFARVTGINTYMTRDGDYLVYNNDDDRKRSDLYNRLDYINSIDNSTLISIHQNFFENEKEWGMQIWYSPNDYKSPVLADKILSITKSYIQPDNNRSNKKSDDSYYILYRATKPSVMVECGFMSNVDENERLKDNNYQNKLAYSIMLGYCDYISGEAYG